MSSSGRIILFDVMSTLVNEPFLEHIPRFFGMTLEELVRAKDPHSWIEFEHGRIDEAEYVRTFFADRRPVDRKKLTEWMYNSYAWLDGVEDLLSELSAKGVPMYALSNYSRWYELIDQKLRLSRFIDWSFVSCNTGKRKPDPEAYLIATRTLGAPADRFVFVDDRPKNVDVAVSLGMHGILRVPEDIEKLRHDLAAAGTL